MKQLKHALLVFCTLTLSLLLSCSKDDGGPNHINIPPNNTSADSYVKFSINGSAVNGLFEIVLEDEDYNTENIGEEGFSGAVGIAYDQDTNEGTVRTTSLTYVTWGAAPNDYFEVKMALPAHTGPLEVGEILTPEGWVDAYPTFYMTLRFLSEDAFYDSNNDGFNDLTTSLLSKTLSVTITAVEEAPDSYGMLALTHIKGSFEGTAYFNAYADAPPSFTQQLLHTITGEFEYNLPVD